MKGRWFLTYHTNEFSEQDDIEKKELKSTEEKDAYKEAQNLWIKIVNKRHRKHLGTPDRPHLVYAIPLQV